MRHFRFRAWHAVNKIMAAHREISVGLKNINNKSGWEYMQWTGLSDQNGVPIYEGDLMRVKMPAITETGEPRMHGGEVVEPEIVVASEAEVIAEVRICPKHTFLSVRKKIHSDLAGIGTRLKIRKDDVVIGNIWENPELIE